MTGDKEKSRRLASVFLLGGILFNYPILSLFNLRILWLGVPVLYFYVFFVWVVLIVMTMRITRHRHKPDHNQPQN
jgi:hypothetical protein